MTMTDEQEETLQAVLNTMPVSIQAKLLTLVADIFTTLAEWRTMSEPDQPITTPTAKL